MAYLDSCNTVNEDGSITLDAYRKKSHTDRYLNFESHHPIKHKAVVVDTLYIRAIRILSTQQGRSKEIGHICTGLGANGYPEEFIKRRYKNILKKKRNKALDPEPLNREQCKGYAVIPYIRVSVKRVNVLYNNII